MDEEMKSDYLQESNGYIHESLQLTPPTIVKLESLDEQIDLKPSDISIVKEELLNVTPGDPLKCSFLSSCKGPESLSESVKTTLHLVKEETHGEVSTIPEVKVETTEATDESTYLCGICHMTFLNKRIYSMHFNVSHQTTTPVSLVTKPPTPPTPQASTKPTRTRRRRQNSILATRKLIECVRNNPCLYDAGNENYTNEDFKLLTWATIAAECKFSDGATAKGEWKTLFTRMINSLTITGEGPSNRTQRTWQYRREMEFMLPFVTDDDIHSLQRLQDATSSDQTNDVSSSYNMRQRVEVPPLTAKRKRTSTAETSTSTSDGQPLDMFFLSMCATTKNLPPYVQLQVKKKIFNAVIEAEEIVAAMHNDQATQEDQYQNNLSPFSVPSNPEEEWQED